MTRHLFLFLLTILGALQSLKALETDTLIIGNGDRQLFGVHSRPDGPSGKQLPIAIVAHGFNGDHEYGINYFEPLAEAGYQCYTFDFPCGGVNSHIDNNTVNMSVADEVSDLLAAVDYFAGQPGVDSDRIVLIGESQGGLVASLAASAEPQKIYKLVLCFGAFGLANKDKGRYASMAEIPDTTYIWRVPIGRRFFTELREMDCFGDMHKYARPVLLLHGDKDPVVPISSSEKALGLYPNVRMKVIKGAGHGFNGDDFRRSTAYVRDFLLNDTKSERSLEDAFMHPSQLNKPIIIWQWMDGLVTKEGITRDLEAFKEAGLAGVQNFQIGGPLQIRIGNPDNAIGSDNWKGLMRHALDECERLGLTFGTHNCPGWSSSAHPAVEPQYSMLKLVYTDTPLPQKPGKTFVLPQPEVDTTWNYYADVAVMAVPADSVASLNEIIDLTPYFDSKNGTLRLPKNVNLPAGTSILRIGQTTNGQTNWGQAPESGRGLECDKLSRVAVKKFWDLYPAMLIDIAGHHAGKTFTHLEVDSYEAGGQTWSPALPAEFASRAGYNIMPYLPYMLGRLKIVDDDAASKRFSKDWVEIVRQCVAENYYGYLSELAYSNGIRLLVEPYGTHGQKPFGIIDFEKIVRACPNADIATEFWQAPDWGWKDMRRHEASMRRLGKPMLVAEAFTCWPLQAWSDSPATIKPMCDMAFCTGVNRMILHAGAANPWPGVQPGMSFGVWGTHFVPGQTWWRAGGAGELFGYMARCQSLLQRGLPAPVQYDISNVFRTYRRVDGDTDIVFVANPTDTVATDRLNINIAGRSAEIWDPYKMTMYSAAGSDIALTVEPFGSRFVVIRPGKSDKPQEPVYIASAEIPVDNEWTIDFPEIGTIVADSLFSWPVSENKDIKYFSGTATYRSTVALPDTITAAGPVYISLGEVKDMAAVTVNGKAMPLLWKAPYICEITEAVRPGENDIEIAVTNLWPNRMIGDEQEPDDLEWSEPYQFGPQKSAGSYLTSQPDWLVNGTERPSKGRKTVGCFKFFRADSPLLPSGLLGPVRLLH